LSSLDKLILDILLFLEKFSQAFDVLFVRVCVCLT
jgi:hypothetical protein